MNKNNIAVVVGGTGSIGAALTNELKQQGFFSGCNVRTVFTANVGIN